MDVNQLIKNAGHKSLLPLQKKALEVSSAKDHIILLSKTGSGKTLAFLLSIINLLQDDTRGVQALIVAPTRELCLQIEEEFKSLKSGFHSVVCYGGHPVRIEANNLKANPSVVIGTPGRLCDHITRENLDLNATHFFIVDEYDKCLEFGFKEELDFIHHKLGDLSTRMFVSATELDETPYRNDDDSSETINFIKEDDTIDLTTYFVDYQKDLKGALIGLMNQFQLERTILFCNYREVVDDIVGFFEDHEITSIGYHGGLEQEDRERAIIKFKNKSANILVCTDLGSRGLDISDVEHVVHYQYPSSKEAFIHRNGRTARMESTGNVYLFIGDNTQLPEYIEKPNKQFSIKNTENLYPLPEFETIYFSAGKKDKINKIDFVGFLSKVGKLKPNEIGLINVLDHTSYVAIARDKVRQTLGRIKGEKVKGKKLKIELSK